MSQGLTNYHQNMWMTALRSIFSQGLATSRSKELISLELSNMSQSLPFFHPKMSELLTEGPHFIKNSGDPLQTRTQKILTLKVSTSLSLELMEWEKTLEALMERNREMENILASMKAP